MATRSFIPWIPLLTIMAIVPGVLGDFFSATSCLATGKGYADDDCSDRCPWYHGCWLHDEGAGVKCYMCSGLSKWIIIIIVIVVISILASVVLTLCCCITDCLLNKCCRRGSSRQQVVYQRGTKR